MIKFNSKNVHESTKQKLSMMVKILNEKSDVVANKSYEDTEYHQAFCINANSMEYSFGDDDRVERVVKAFFCATSAYLSKVKISNAEKAVALILTDVTGNFKFAGIVEYHENDDNSDEPGNWSYSLTFNEEDVTNIEKDKSVTKYLYSGDAFKSVFDKVAYDVTSIAFDHDTYMYDACLLVIDTLVQILDREAKEGETVDIELPGYFVASVAIEDGDKVFSITPDGHQKEIIKNDIALQDKF